MKIEEKKSRSILEIKYLPQVLLTYLFYSRSQWWDSKKFEKYQDKMLIKLIKHAAINVPYYRKLFKEINFSVHDFRGRIDIHKIPLLDKEIVRTRHDEFIADNAKTYGINFDSTSGSTGTPLQLIIDNKTKINKISALIRSYKWAGYSFRKKAISIQSFSFDGSAPVIKYFPLYNLLRIESKKISNETGKEIIKVMNDYKPKVVMGYPFPIFWLGQYSEKNNLEIVPIKSVITAGEQLSKKRRELIKNTYKCSVYDFYSLHECSAIISECEYGAKHIAEDFAYNEVLDDEGNDASKSGIGELVGTSFYNYAMPLIRFRTRDNVILEKGKKCKCGRQFRIINEILGRQNDFIETPDGRFLGNVMEHSIDRAKGVISSQCVQDAIDHIYINVVADKDFSEDSMKEIEKGVKRRIGDCFKIDFKIVDQLEKNKGGKSPFVLSKIGNDYI